jgi:starch phosphorylase
VSGIKAALNGALHCGMREGWWAQAFAPTSGFVIDAAQNVGDDGRARDQHDASVLYDLLEREIAPTFYERDEHDLPRRWLAMMRESMAVAARDFSSDRMVHEYVEELYLPAARAQTQRLADGGRIALEIETSLTRLRERWHSIRFGELREEIYHGTRRATIDIDLAGIPATDVRVELYAESNIEGRCILVLDREGDTYVAILDDDRPLRDFTARIIPAVQGLSPLEAPLMAWHDRVLSYV